MIEQFQQSKGIKDHKPPSGSSTERQYDPMEDAAMEYKINNSYCAVLQTCYFLYCPDFHPESFDPNN